MAGPHVENCLLQKCLKNFFQCFFVIVAVVVVILILWLVTQYEDYDEHSLTTQFRGACVLSPPPSLWCADVEKGN